MFSRKKKIIEPIIGPIWFIMVDDKEIGTLSNGRPETNSEFWTLYDMYVTNATYDKLAADSEYWYKNSVYLKNQSNPSIVIRSFLVALRGQKQIAIRIVID